MTAHTLDSTGHRTAAAGRRTLAGALGGVAGGLVFDTMVSLMGHLIYALLTAAVTVLISRGRA